MAHKNKKNFSPYSERHNERRKDEDKLRSNNSYPKNQGKHKKAQHIYELNEASDRLADIFRNHEFDLINHEERLLLAQFYRLLMQQQDKENFTRLLSLKDIAIKHFIDCIIILNYTQLQFPLLDMGTGPGFPGIPLKIKFPHEKIILAEGVQKRVHFLKECRDKLSLNSVDIIGRNINPSFAYPVNGVITRAVEDISNTLHNCQNCLQLGGKIYLMKGPGVDPEIKMAKERWSSIFKLTKDISYSLPHTPHQRRLVIYEKIKNTSYPEDDPESDLLLDELSPAEKKRWSQNS